MSKLVALHNAIHKNLQICAKKTGAYGAGLAMIPVVLSEFLKLVIQFPIVVTKNKDTGQFICVILLGLKENENLFYQNEQWTSFYTPLQIIRQPFFLGQGDGEKSSQEDRYEVCFDTESDSVVTKGGEALFDKEGRPTDYLTRIQSILTELLEGEEKTKAFIDELLALKLLQPIQLDVNFKNEESNQINGLYSVDETKLSELNSDVIATLHKKGYLSYIYTMVASMGQIYALVQKKEALISNDD